MIGVAACFCGRGMIIRCIKEEVACVHFTTMMIRLYPKRGYIRREGMLKAVPKRRGGGGEGSDSERNR